MNKQERRKLLWGYFFILPIIIGLLLFVFGPMIFSLIASFTQWDMISPMKNVGFGNYTELFTEDERFYKSLRVTFYYTVLAVPAINIYAFFLAMLLNTKAKGMSFFRTAFYIPSIVPIVASAAMWLFIYNPTFGLLNQLLEPLGIGPQNWIFSENLVIPSLVAMVAWSAGGTMVIYLAGLQSVPTHLYESVEIDGGGRIRKFWSITLPMMSPIIFFNAIMSFIGSMQMFTEAYVMTGGGPNDASLMYMMYLYTKAFSFQEMGIASAMAWVLFIMIALLTALIFKTSSFWVYYENEVRR